MSWHKLYRNRRGVLRVGHRPAKGLRRFVRGQKAKMRRDGGAEKVAAAEACKMWLAQGVSLRDEGGWLKRS